MKLNSVLLAAAAFVAATGAQAQVYSANFNNYQNGGAAAAQSTTGLTVFAFGDLPGFTKAGQNSVHAVDRGNGDYAPMFYNGDSAAQANSITSGLIAANVLGQVYRVTFDGAFGSYNNAVQQTQPGNGDGVLFTLFGGVTTVASYTYTPTSFTYAPASFTYVGRGTGDFRLTVQGVGGAGEFGGSIDNLAISAVAPVPEPATWATMMLGLGMVGAGLRHRARRTVRLGAA